MNGERHCGTVRERLPAFAAGRLSVVETAEIEDHLVSCGACRSEAELVGLLRSVRPMPPQDLSRRIREHALPSPDTGMRPWWGLAAAAVAALALGIGVVTSGGPPLGSDVPAYAAATEEMELWLGEDGLIAGAPALEGLSEEALFTLLEEMTAGGAA